MAVATTHGPAPPTSRVRTSMPFRGVNLACINRRTQIHWYRTALCSGTERRTCMPRVSVRAQSAKHTCCATACPIMKCCDDMRLGSAMSVSMSCSLSRPLVSCTAACRACTISSTAVRGWDLCSAVMPAPTMRAHVAATAEGAIIVLRVEIVCGVPLGGWDGKSCRSKKKQKDDLFEQVDR